MIAIFYAIIIENYYYLKCKIKKILKTTHVLCSQLIREKLDFLF